MTGPGYSAQCKACNSPSRPEIDRRLLGGETTRAVSEWLATTGEKITFQSIANHKAEHLAVREAALAKLAESQPVFEGTVEKIVADVNVLDRIAERALAATEGAPPTDMAGAVLYTGCLREARAAVVAKHDILHGKKVNVEMSGLAELLAQGFDE